MYNDKIYFKEDVIKAYAAKRKGMKNEEVEDLLNCLIGFLKNDVQYDKQYAYDIPSIGQLYMPFTYFKEEITYMCQNRDRFDKIMFENMIGRSFIINRKDKFAGETKEEIQKLQNEET